MTADETSRAATITAAAAAAKAWNVIVVGAGPAGGAAAVQLARAGLSVLLIDRNRFPRPKVCGCCLSPLAVAELTRLNAAGSSAEPAGDLVPLTTVQLVAGGRTARLPLPAGRVQSREALDPALVRQAAAAGAAWLPETRVVSCEPTPSQVRVTVATTTGERLSLLAERLVLAGGLAEAVRVGGNGSNRPAERLRPHHNLIGLGATLPGEGSSLPSGELVMAVADGGYCGLVRLEDGRIDLAAAVDPRAVATAAGPAAALARLLSRTGVMEGDLLDPGGLAAATVRATPPLTHQTPPVDPASERIYRVGDATGYVEPFTGEGIGWALHAARLLAESLVDQAGQLRPAAAAADCYRRRHRSAFGSRHRRCRRVALALRSPLLVAAAVRAADWFPSLAGRAARLCTGTIGSMNRHEAAIPRSK